MPFVDDLNMSGLGQGEAVSYSNMMAKAPYSEGCSKRLRDKACEDRAAERTLGVREQREPKRNAVYEPFSTAFVDDLGLASGRPFPGIDSVGGISSVPRVLSDGGSSRPSLIQSLPGTSSVRNILSEDPEHAFYTASKVALAKTATDGSIPIEAVPVLAGALSEKASAQGQPPAQEEITSGNIPSGGMETFTGKVYQGGMEVFGREKPGPSLSAAPEEPNFLERLFSGKGRQRPSEKLTEADRARAANIVAMANETNLPLNFVEKNYDRLSQELEMRGNLTGEELKNALITAATIGGE